MAAIYWRGIGALRERALPMNKKTFACLAAIVLSVLPAAWAQVQPAVLTIHVDQPISKVSPTLYGLMTEEINYSYDGGCMRRWCAIAPSAPDGRMCRTGC